MITPAGDLEPLALADSPCDLPRELRTFDTLPRTSVPARPLQAGPFDRARVPVIRFAFTHLLRADRQREAYGPA